MRLVQRLACFVVVGSVAAGAPAFAAAWQPLGERIIDYRTNPETISTPDSKDPITKIKIAVRQDDLEIHNVTVVFGDGKTFDVALNKYIGHGQSRVIDLPSAETIQKVQFTYSKASTEPRVAVVELFGSN